MVSLEIYNTNCLFKGSVPDPIFDRIIKETSYMHQGHMYMKNSYKWYGGWDGTIKLFKNKKFPIGLLPRVLRILKDSGIKVEINDFRQNIKYGKSLTIDNKCFFKPRKYQIDALKACVKNKSGVVKIATGGGKTGTIAMLVGHYNIKTVIYVIGVELLYQMKETIETLYPDLEVGIIGDGVCDIKKINIATIWSAAAAFNKKIDILDSDVTYDKKANSDIDKHRVRKMVEESQLFILDECQYAAANTVQFLHKISKKAKHRFLFSASPWRDSGDDILIEAVGGEKIFDLKASKLIEDGFLVKPHIYFVNVPSQRGVGKTYQEVYKNYIVENEDRNQLIKKAVDKLIAKNKKILILVVRVNHGKKILNLLKDSYKVEFLDGKKTSSQRLEAIKGMRRGDIDVLVASKIFDQGIDIPELDALILAGSGKSTGRALQRIGRVIRKADGKDKAIVVEFMDNAKYLKSHSETRKSVYETEPEFLITLSNKKATKVYKKRKPFRWT